MFQHQPPCPAGDGSDHQAACLVSFHPEQGWALLCNGWVIFNVASELLHDQRSIRSDRRPVRTGSMRRSATPAEAPRVRRAAWTLLRELSSVPDARRLVRTQLASWGLAEHSDVAELLASELVTNALHHAWGNPVLTLSCQGGTVRCEVEDANPAVPHLSHADQDDVGGRGLYLVDRLSCSWGSDRISEGKVVWFELPALEEVRAHG
jgi:anti-sigma regulatory factor (Ser/Thr protein kinase)